MTQYGIIPCKNNSKAAIILENGMMISVSTEGKLKLTSKYILT